MERSSRDFTENSQLLTQKDMNEMRKYKDDTTDGIAYSEIATGIGINQPTMALSAYLDSISFTFSTEQPPPELLPEYFTDLGPYTEFEIDVDLNGWVLQFMCFTLDIKPLSVNMLRMCSTLCGGNAYIENCWYRYERKTEHFTKPTDLSIMYLLSRAAKMVIKSSTIKTESLRNIQRWLIYYLFGRPINSIVTQWSPSCKLPRLTSYSTHERLLTNYYTHKLSLFKNLRDSHEVYGGNYENVYKVIFLQYLMTNGRYGTGSTKRNEHVNIYSLPNVNPEQTANQVRCPSIGLMYARAMLTIALIRGYSECRTPYVYITQLEIEHPFTNTSRLTDGAHHVEQENQDHVKKETELVDVENIPKEK